MEKENELGAILANSEKQGTCKCGNDHDNCKCQEISEAELRRKLDLLLRTGKILVESAADTSRIDCKHHIIISRNLIAYMLWLTCLKCTTLRIFLIICGNIAPAFSAACQ